MLVSETEQEIRQKNKRSGRNAAREIEEVCHTLPNVPDAQQSHYSYLKLGSRQCKPKVMSTRLQNILFYTQLALSLHFRHEGKQVHTDYVEKYIYIQSMSKNGPKLDFSILKTY